MTHYFKVGDRVIVNPKGPGEIGLDRGWWTEDRVYAVEPGPNGSSVRDDDGVFWLVIPNFFLPAPAEQPAKPHYFSPGDWVIVKPDGYYAGSFGCWWTENKVYVVEDYNGSPMVRDDDGDCRFDLSSSCFLLAPSEQPAGGWTTTAAAILDEVNDQVAKAMAKWPAFNSAHEGFAVLLEEVDELKAHVWTNQKRRNMDAMRQEALQVAAIAVRFVRDICDGNRGDR